MNYSMTLLLLAVTGLSMTVSSAAPVLIKGHSEEKKGVSVVQSRNAVFELHQGELASFRLSARIRLAPASGRPIRNSMLMLVPDSTTDLSGKAMSRVSIMRSNGKHDGRLIRFLTYRFDVQENKWSLHTMRRLVFWPTIKGALKNLEQDGIAERSWHNQWIDLRIDVGPHAVTVWADGMFVDRVSRVDEERPVSPIVLALRENDALDKVTIVPWHERPLYLPVDLTELANTRADRPFPSLDVVPFEALLAPRNCLSLHAAGWIDQKRDPQSFYELYDGGGYFANDPRMPMISVPKDDYVAAHLLAIADEDPALTNAIALRVGRYGYNKQVFRRDFGAVVPRNSATGGYVHVVVPMIDALAQDILDDVMDIELTKPVSLARHVPDPNRFRYRPLGPASGVRIAALTLERSPLQMRVRSDEAGHAFVEPSTPVFEIELRNITEKLQPYALVLEAIHLRGGKSRSEASGSVEPDQTAIISVPIKPVRRGYHDLTVTLRGTADRILLRRTTSFAQLPPDTRTHRDESPFGAWEWNGTHVTSTNSDVVGSLFKKMGFRYGMTGHSIESRKKWGMTASIEAKLDPELKKVKKFIDRDPDWPQRGLIFHETSISGPHVTRVPDLFTDRPPYKLNEKEETRYQEMLGDALASGKAAREQYPDMFISFGNGPLPNKEEFYRRKFPADLFDAGGNEAGSFHRLPETQPPDSVAHNASVWMDRQMLDAYGYADKAVHHCYEICVQCDNPGNHSPATQADIFVRNSLHSLAWGMDFLHIGQIMDVGNSYYFSNWGASGFCRAYPEMNVKPAYVAMATLTTVLDGARCVRVHDTGSPSVFALEFERTDGQRVLALWTIRGRRPITVSVTQAPWTVIDDQGNESVAPKVLEATASPVYLIGPGKIETMTLGDSRYIDAPGSRSSLLSPMDALQEWNISKDRSAELEAYNFLTPRRKGNFEFTAVSAFEGRGGSLRVTPRSITHGKDTMPMYAELVHHQGLAIPGEPNEIGLQINGNSGWGRVIYGLVDASGQRWTSIGAAAAGEAPAWQLDWMPKEMQAEGSLQQNDWSTNDPYGYSRINFDGWRYVGFPLPGNYPGEQHPWPANSFWRWDGDGVVHYPLTLTKLVIEWPEKVLHVKRWAPVPRQAIYLKELIVSHRE